MSFARLTAKQIARAEKRMKTRDFAARVEVWRARTAAGEKPNFEAMADDLKIPVQIILAICAQNVERETGQRIRPMGRAS